MEILITEDSEGRCAVAERDGENVHPTTFHPNRRDAAARVLQLLDLGPVAPQTHPEEICIGRITVEA